VQAPRILKSWEKQLVVGVYVIEASLRLLGMLFGRRALRGEGVIV
jgi:hypothetical protein